MPSLSLRMRLMLWYGLLLAVSLFAFGSLLYLVLRANLERQVDESLRVRAAQISRAVAAGDGGELTSSDLPAGLLGPRSVDEAVGPELYVQVLDDHATLVAASGTQLPIDPETVIMALSGQETLTSLPLTGGRSVRLLTRPLLVDGRTVGVVQVGDTLDSIAATLEQVRDILLAASLVVLVLAGLGGLLLGGRALKPVRVVSATARRISQTADYGQRLPARRAQDEVGELVGTFNALIERVESSLNEQRRFLADTSHELRSPLTVIRANLGFLWRETDPETRAECLREAEAEAARMSRLVTDLLLLGQAESDEFLQRAPVALGDLLGEVAEQGRAQADGREIVVGPLEPVVVSVDRDRLKQALINLLDNALRYSRAGGLISLSLRREGPWVELAVADEGPGIPVEHLPRLFERFYRVDRARARNTGGAGLGLAIVRHIAQAHGGSVSVESTVDRGSIFKVRLPAHLPDPAPIEVEPSPGSIAHSPPLLHGASK